MLYQTSLESSSGMLCQAFILLKSIASWEAFFDHKT